MTPHRAAIVLLMALVSSASFTAAAGGQEPDRSHSPFFEVLSPDPSGETFPLKSTGVDVTVTGVIADVVVTQLYANEGTGPINARYVFPASTRAAVHGMRMTIGGQVVVARLEERRKAVAVFEAARAEGKSASLLEQQRPNVFTMSVANILPGDRVEVELHYSELLVPTDGTYEFVYPTVVGPRYAGRRASLVEPARWLRVPFLLSGGPPPSTLDIRMTLVTGLPVQDVRCPSHGVDLAFDASDRVEVRLKAGLENAAGNRDFILQYRLAGEEIQSGLILHQGESENFFLLMVQPPERVAPAQVAPREYVFILDVSGSMNGFPLDTAKGLLADLIRRLRGTDLFNVVLFAGASRSMAPASVPASEENIARALRVIEEPGGGGGTELVPALMRALALPRDEGYARAVVVVTDGFVEADREVVEIIRRNLHETSFFSFGIGASVNRFLVEGIARAGMGEPFVVTSPEEAPGAVERFRAYVESPLLTGAQAAFHGLDVYDVEPPVLPDLFAGRPLVLFGKWRGAPRGSIEVTGQGAEGPYRQVLQADAVHRLQGHDALGSLWARARIARLSDFGFGDRPDVEDEITALGLRHSLLTKNTAFVAVLEQVRAHGGEARDVDQPLPLPAGVSPMAVGFEYRAGSEPAIWILAALVITAFAVRRIVT